MYKSLLNDYEARQQSLMVENSELKKVLQQMKRDMMYILSPHKPCAKGSPGDDSHERVPSDYPSIYLTIPLTGQIHH